MSKTIGIIGLGSIGMRHANNLQAMGHKVWGYDPDMEKRLELNGVLWEIDEMFADQACDAIIIASPTSAHHHQLLDVLQTDKPVLVEKPIADGMANLADAMEGKQVYVGNNLRFHSCVIRAKEWLDEGLIGKPYAASFMVGQLNSKPYKEDVILNWGAHELDLARYLLGEAMVISCVGNRDNADIIMQHLQNGCQTTVHLDYLASPPLRGFSIIGHNGRISVDLERRIAQLKKVVNENLFKADSSDSWDENYKDEMQSFIDAIDGKPSAPLATGSDGLASLEMILKAKELAGIE